MGPQAVSFPSGDDEDEEDGDEEDGDEDEDEELETIAACSESST